MLETLVVVAIMVLIVLAVRVLAAGSETIIDELVPPNRQLAWPRGVQEEDAPQFVFDHATRSA